MTAYWLAYMFGVDPDVFLAKDPDTLYEHARRTAAMKKRFKL